MGKDSYAYDENVVSLVNKISTSIESHFMKWGILDKVCYNEENPSRKALMAYDAVSFALDAINADAIIKVSGREYIRKCFGEYYTDERIDAMRKRLRKKGYEKTCLWLPLIISVDKMMGAQGNVALLYMMCLSYFAVGLLQTTPVYTAGIIKYHKVCYSCKKAIEINLDTKLAYDPFDSLTFDNMGNDITQIDKDELCNECKNTYLRDLNQRINSFGDTYSQVADTIQERIVSESVFLAVDSVNDVSPERRPQESKEMVSSTQHRKEGHHMDSTKEMLESSGIKDKSFVDWLCEKYDSFKIVVYQGMDAMKAGIEALDLSVRSYNCIRRAGYETIDSLIEDIDSRSDFGKIRNMGKKSANEVMLKLFLYTYSNLKPEKRKAYLEKIRSLN